IELPIEIDPEQVEAEYKHGLLKVTLPKAVAAKPKQINVSVA
ncbi:molecular chaperone, partial [Candidatus Entotheonella serta]